MHSRLTGQIKSTGCALPIGHIQLVVPNWPSTPFWPMLFPGLGTMAPFVVELKVLLKSELKIIPGRMAVSLFNGSPNADVLALKLVPTCKSVATP